MIRLLSVLLALAAAVWMPDKASAAEDSFGSCMYCAFGDCELEQNPSNCDGLYDDCDCTPVCDCRWAEACGLPSCQTDEDEDHDMDLFEYEDGWSVSGNWVDDDAFGVRSKCGVQTKVIYTEEGLASRTAQARVLRFSRDGQDNTVGTVVRRFFRAVVHHVT